MSAFRRARRLFLVPLVCSLLSFSACKDDRGDLTEAGTGSLDGDSIFFFTQTPYCSNTWSLIPARCHAWQAGQPKSPYSIMVTGAVAGPMVGSSRSTSALPECVPVRVRTNPPARMAKTTKTATAVFTQELTFALG